MRTWREWTAGLRVPPGFTLTTEVCSHYYAQDRVWPAELAGRLETLGNVEVFEDPIPKSDLEGYVKIHDAIREAARKQKPV